MTREVLTPVILGNVKQLFARDAWDFQKELVETYGPVTRIHGFFRV